MLSLVRQVAERKIFAGYEKRVKEEEVQKRRRIAKGERSRERVEEENKERRRIREGELRKWG